MDSVIDGCMVAWLDGWLDVWPNGWLSVVMVNGKDDCMDTCRAGFMDRRLGGLIVWWFDGVLLKMGMFHVNW